MNTFLPPPRTTLFNALFEATPEAIVVTDRPGRIRVVNRQTEVLFGHDRAPLLGQSVEVLLPARFRDRHVQHRATYAAAPHTRPMGAGLDLWGRHADGHEFPVEVSLSPVATDDGLVVISLIRDITAHREAIAERQRLLASAQAARAEAETAVRVRDQFLAALTHDLGQPLTTLRTAAQLGRRAVARTGAVDVGRVADYLTMIESAAATVQAMTSELVDLARLQSGHELDLVYRSTDLVVLVRQEVATQQAATPAHNLQFAPAVPTLVGPRDGVRLTRVVANLLSNAVKYSPDGGAVVVTVKPAADGGRTWAVLTVADHGLGIPAADLPQLFARFHRGRNVVGRIAGTGIGLASAKSIVEGHGGTITVASDEGRGTTVTVRLPLD